MTSIDGCPGLKSEAEKLASSPPVKPAAAGYAISICRVSNCQSAKDAKPGSRGAVRRRGRGITQRSCSREARGGSVQRGEPAEGGLCRLRDGRLFCVGLRLPRTEVRGRKACVIATCEARWRGLRNFDLPRVQLPKREGRQTRIPGCGATTRTRHHSALLLARGAWRERAAGGARRRRALPVARRQAFLRRTSAAPD